MYGLYAETLDKIHIINIEGQSNLSSKDLYIYYILDRTKDEYIEFGEYALKIKHDTERRLIVFLRETVKNRTNNESWLTFDNLSEAVSKYKEVCGLSGAEIKSILNSCNFTAGTFIIYMGKSENGSTATFKVEVKFTEPKDPSERKIGGYAISVVNGEAIVEDSNIEVLKHNAKAQMIGAEERKYSLDGKLLGYHAKILKSKIDGYEICILEKIDGDVSCRNMDSMYAGVCKNSKMDLYGIKALNIKSGAYIDVYMGNMHNIRIERLLYSRLKAKNVEKCNISMGRDSLVDISKIDFGEIHISDRGNAEFIYGEWTTEGLDEFKNVKIRPVIDLDRVGHFILKFRSSIKEDALRGIINGIISIKKAHCDIYIPDIYKTINYDCIKYWNKDTEIVSDICR